MIILYIGLTILTILLLLFLFAYFIHNRIFGSRWKKDECIDYYKPSDFEGLNVESWQFSLDKETLKGEIYSYNKPTKGIVVFAHGMWSGMISYTQEMEYFARCGYRVFGFNYEGTDTSSGKNIRGLANSVRCLDVAISYIKKQFKNEKIYVCGHSWGGFAASNIAGYQNNISAICALAPFSSLKTAYNTLFPPVMKPLIPFIILVDRLKCGKYAKSDAINLLQKTTVPTLIIHSTDDYLLKYDKTTKVLKEAINNDKVSFITVENKGHNPEYCQDAVEYMKTTSLKLKELPEDKKIEYKKTLDYHRMGALDYSIMNKIFEFFEKNN